MAAMTAGRARSLPPQPEVNVRQIIEEARNRWLRPVEVCEILRNYTIHNFKLNPVPPQQPQSGSLYLFDRKILRYFRKDGHNWRKKKDGKTVREAHERLKAGSVDVLHCYYAHGLDNVNFQRRCYWMLDPAHDHIVLVHYREVTETSRSCIISRNMHDFQNPVFHSQVSGQQQHSVLGGLTTLSAASTSVASPETVDGMLTSRSPEFDEVESVDVEEPEEIGHDIEGEPAGLQPSLLEQLGDQQQLAGIHRPLSSEQWSSLGRNTTSLGGMDAQFMSLYATQETDFKPTLSDLSQVAQRTPITTQGINNQILVNFTRGGDVGSINRQYADMLDSPGSSYSSNQQNPPTTHPLDLANITSFIGNGGGRFAKAEGNSPTWRQVFEEVTTPSSRKTLLENHGLPVGLGQSSLGKDPLHPHGPPVSPKGIVDALSPKNLGREPQTTLEANLRAVTEKEVIKEADMKAQQVQRSRWQTSLLDSPQANLVNRPVQELSGGQHINDSHFVESGTLEQLVRSGQSHQDTSPRFGKEKVPWSQLPQQQLQHEQMLNFHNMNQFEQLNFQRPQQDQRLQLPLPPPQQSNLGLLETGNLCSPTIEHLLKEVNTEDVANLGHRDGMEKFKKLYSFGNWMNTDIGNDSQASLEYSPVILWDSNPLESLVGLSQQEMQMDQGLTPSPSLSEQCFNISDFSPEWGSDVEDTKVLITGSFVENINPSEHKWACMFGEKEVPADLLDKSSLRCKAPKHVPGRVPFYITRSDRQACSEIREFEYRSSEVSETKDDLLLKLQFSRMLMASSSKSSNCRSANRTQIFKESEDDEWKSLERMLQSNQSLALVKEQLLQLILKRRLNEWLQVRLQEDDGQGPSVHDDHGLGVSHFAAALGYVWSISPLSRAGIPINFRDSGGWTALHHAAHHGREEVVCALLEAGATPNLITDPNPKCPAGLTASDLATARGHGGIAAFLAERSIAVRLSGLKLDDGIVMDEESAAKAGDQAVAQLSRRSSIRSSVSEIDDHVALQASLEAVRNSAQGAALIHNAFRQYSLQRRMQNMNDDDLDEYGLSGSQVRSVQAAQKIQKAYRGHQKKKLHVAATRIQRKFRGWKGRKDFQTLRKRIIKIQAHVRGRIVRNRYRKLLWSVSIIDKVVLRWLRKRKGLRGFRSDVGDPESIINGDDDDLMREGRHRTQEAVEKDFHAVQSMAREKSARQQYARLSRLYRADSGQSPHSDVQSPTDYLNQDSMMGGD